MLGVLDQPIEWRALSSMRARLLNASVDVAQQVQVLVATVNRLCGSAMLSYCYKGDVS